MIDVRRLLGPLVAIVVLAAVLAALQASGLAFWQGLFVSVAIFVIIAIFVVIYVTFSRVSEE